MQLNIEREREGEREGERESKVSRTFVGACAYPNTIYETLRGET